MLFMMIRNIKLDHLENNKIVCSLHQSYGRCATKKYFQIIGNIYDIESYIDNTRPLNITLGSYIYHLLMGI